MEYSFRLAARVLLYASSHRQDNTYYSLCYTSCGALNGMTISSMGPPWKADPTTHPTMSDTLTIELHLAPEMQKSTVGGLPRQGSYYYWSLLFWDSYRRKSSRFGMESWQEECSSIRTMHTSKVAMDAIQKCRFQRSSVVIILPEMMMLWMLWTTFWGTKMMPSTQEWILHDCWTK